MKMHNSEEVQTCLSISRRASPTDMQSSTTTVFTSHGDLKLVHFDWLPKQKKMHVNKYYYYNLPQHNRCNNNFAQWVNMAEREGRKQSTCSTLLGRCPAVPLGR